MQLFQSLHYFSIVLHVHTDLKHFCAEGSLYVCNHRERSRCQQILSDKRLSDCSPFRVTEFCLCMWERASTTDLAVCLQDTFNMFSSPFLNTLPFHVIKTYGCIFKDTGLICCILPDIISSYHRKHYIVSLGRCFPAWVIARFLYCSQACFHVHISVFLCVLSCVFSLC